MRGREAGVVVVVGACLPDLCASVCLRLYGFVLSKMNAGRFAPTA